MTIEDLKNIATDKARTARHIYEMSVARADLEREMRLIRQGIYAEVSAALDDNGKPRFSNAEKREAETDARLQFDDDYAAKKAELAKIIDGIELSRIELAHSTDILSIELAFAKA